ncbi:MAG: diguanylate cyclase [Saccharospirillum sp.]|nr:diguanylate cyclase [Saccharospirillum sp.]
MGSANLAHPVSSVSDRVTVRVGLITTIPNKDCDDVLKLADRALYRAKHQGRNRLEASELS